MARVVPSESYFEGHFPGYPVLPGIAQLALLSQVLEACGHDGKRIRSVPMFRLLDRIEPLEPLTIRLEFDGLRVNCRIEQAGDPAARGTFFMASGSS